MGENILVSSRSPIANAPAKADRSTGKSILAGNPWAANKSASVYLISQDSAPRFIESHIKPGP